MATAPETPRPDAREDACSRRAALGGLLRARREQLLPADLGLPPGTRRRTPGLRREEVATEAGVSITYLTYLEQGRDVRPSAQVLQALAGALRMSDAQRENLFELAHGTAPPHEAPRADPVHPVTLDLLDALDPTPAYLVDWRGDILALNHGAYVLFGEDWVDRRGIDRNGTYWLLTDPDAARLMCIDDDERRAVVARFRMRADRYRSEPAMVELREALRAAVPRFAEWWALHEVAPSTPMVRPFEHPALGRVELGHLTMALGHGDDQRVITYPAPAGSEVATRIAALVRERSQ